MEIFDIIEEADKEAQKAQTNNQKQPNPNLPGEDETLDLSPDLPIMSFMPEQPIMLEQKIDVVVTVILNDPKIEKTVQTINTLCKNRKITSVTYAVSDVTNSELFAAALLAQKEQQLQNSQDISASGENNSTEEFTGAPTEETPEVINPNK